MVEEDRFWELLLFDFPSELWLNDLFSNCIFEIFCSFWWSGIIALFLSARRISISGDETVVWLVWLVWLAKTGSICDKNNICEDCDIFFLFRREYKTGYMFRQHQTLTDVSDSEAVSISLSLCSVWFEYFTLSIYSLKVILFRSIYDEIIIYRYPVHYLWFVAYCMFDKLKVKIGIFE